MFISSHQNPNARDACFQCLDIDEYVFVKSRFGIDHKQGTDDVERVFFIEMYHIIM